MVTTKQDCMSVSDLASLPDMLTVDEAAAVWRISDTQVRRLIALAAPAMRLGPQCRRIPKAWVLSRLADGMASQANEEVNND